jgi:hypothetical protein
MMPLSDLAEDGLSPLADLIPALAAWDHIIQVPRGPSGIFLGEEFRQFSPQFPLEDSRVELFQSVVQDDRESELGGNHLGCLECPPQGATVDPFHRQGT